VNTVSSFYICKENIPSHPVSNIILTRNHFFPRLQFSTSFDSKFGQISFFFCLELKLYCLAVGQTRKKNLRKRRVVITNPSASPAICQNVEMTYLFIRKFLFHILIQWALLNVITDDVLRRIILSVLGGFSKSRQMWN
jgi:hypothetical protein